MGLGGMQWTLEYADLEVRSEVRHQNSIGWKNSTVNYFYSLCFKILLEESGVGALNSGFNFSSAIY